MKKGSSRAAMMTGCSVATTMMDSSGVARRGAAQRRPLPARRNEGLLRGRTRSERAPQAQHGEGLLRNTDDDGLLRGEADDELLRDGAMSGSSG